MQVAGIEIDREEARKRVEEFTSRRRKKLTEMDQALYRGYKALAEGLTLIDVNQAIKEAGHFDESYCPKLAIARSDLERVYFDHRFSYETNPPLHGGQLAPWKWGDRDVDKGPLYKEVWESYIRLPEGHNIAFFDFIETLGLQVSLDPGTIDSPEEERKSSKRWFKSRYETIVPSIPFHLRPNGDASQYFILWEVDEWKEYQAGRAPGDPLLLERIAHPIYVVVAQWDLSELEKRILENFRRR